MTRITATLLAITIGACCSNSANAQYQLIDMGTLGGTSSFGRALNDHRQVTGNAQTPASQPSPRLNAFSWSSPGPMLNLGVLPGSNNFSRGYAINNSGVIVGESDNNNSRAFRWDPVNGMVGLIRLAGDNDRGVAHGINDAGAIVGISSNGVASRPTLWVNGIAQDLGSIDGANTSFGRAWNINNNGIAVGFSSTGIAGVSSKATLWDNGNIINLGSWQSTSFSEAFDVNHSGVAVGAAVNGTTGGGTSIRRATRWEIINGTPVMTDLGSLGLTFSEAKSINDLGQIVGFATNVSGLSQRAFLWDDGVQTDLNSLIDPGLGWTLTTAESINQRGDIVGWGTFGGQTRAYLLVNTIPEPSTTVFAAIAGFTLILRRRR